MTDTNLAHTHTHRTTERASCPVSIGPLMFEWGPQPAHHGLHNNEHDVEKQARSNQTVKCDTTTSACFSSPWTRTKGGVSCASARDAVHGAGLAQATAPTTTPLCAPALRGVLRKAIAAYRSSNWVLNDEFPTISPCGRRRNRTVTLRFARHANVSFEHMSRTGGHPTSEIALAASTFSWRATVPNAGWAMRPELCFPRTTIW